MITAYRTKVARLTERSAHMVYFECNYGNAGYVIVNIALDEWHEMGEPRKLIVTLEPDESDDE